MFGSKRVEILENQVRDLKSELVRISTQDAQRLIDEKTAIVESFDKVVQRFAESQCVARQDSGWQKSCETILESFAKASEKAAKEADSRLEKSLQLHAQVIERHDEAMKKCLSGVVKMLPAHLQEMQSKNFLDFARAQGAALMAVDQAREARASAKFDEKRTEDQQYRAAYALNACMVSVSQIVDYQDVNVLQQEYDALLNNLNLENFPKDEALLDALKKILDVCHFYILHAKDKEMLKKKQARRLKDALGKSLSGGSVIAIFGTANPYALVAGAVAMVGIAAVRYKSERDKAKLENELEEWQLEKSALEQLHNLRRTLFETAWRLSDQYGFKDELRLTERQIKMYNEALAESDPLNRYWCLYQMKGSFKAYPLFWYYLGRAAMEVADAYRPDQRVGESGNRMRYGCGNKDLYEHYRGQARIALEGDDKNVGFLKAHGGRSLLREDVLSAAAYLDCASLHEDNLCEMLKDVQAAHGLSGLDLEINQLCAFRSLQILYGAIDAIAKTKSTDPVDQTRIQELADVAKKSFSIGEETLLLLVHQDFNVEINGRALSKLYIDMCKIAIEKKQKKELRTKYEVLKACIANKHAFAYQWMLPWDDTSFSFEWRNYLNGEGLRRTVFNYFYGRFKCVYADLYKAIAEVERSKDLLSLRNLKEGGVKWSENADKILSKIDDLTAKDPFKGLHNCFWFNHKAGNDKYDEVVKQILQKCHDEKDSAIEIELQLISAIKKFIDSTSERRFVTLGLYRHDTDYSEARFKNDVNDLEQRLVEFVASLTRRFSDELSKKYDDVTQSSLREREDPEAIKLICHIEASAESYRKRCIPHDGKRVFVYPKCKSDLLYSQPTEIANAATPVYIPDYGTYEDFPWDDYDMDEFPRT